VPEAGRLGDDAHAPADAHGCPACAHSVAGPAVSGSSDVMINGRPALRVGDNGVHAACCGPNTWVAVKGASGVLINSRAAHRLGDATQHCGGGGKLITGSPDVIIGDDVWTGDTVEPWLELTWVEIELVYTDGTPAAHEKFRLELVDGSVRTGQLNAHGRARVEGVKIGTCRVSFPGLSESVWVRA
jgi:uncharacterized Zn-binding protein involved in type VI secretion